MTSPAPILNPSAEQADALFQQGRFAEAAPLYQQLVLFRRDDVTLWAHLGLCLENLRQFHPALICFKQALQLNPHNVALLNHCAYCLLHLNRKAETLETFAKALALAPDDYDTRSFYAYALREFDMTAEALALYDDISPLSADHLWCRADIYLRLGRFKDGWKDFEVRWQLGKTYPFWPLREQEQSFTTQRWTGQDLQGKTILVYEEQGFGDCILCSRYIALIKQRGARVIFKCRRELHRLFQSLEGVDRLVENYAVDEQVDYHVPIMSLPAVFGTELHSIPTLPRLHVPESPPAEVQSLLNRGKGRFKVGIVWEGHAGFAGNYKRSAPFTQFLSLAEIPGVQLYSLQKGGAEKEITELCVQDLVLEPGPYLKDFADTAAVLKNLDLVIMADSAVAHVAGSINVPVWTLLSVCPFWLYQMDRPDSPWYPSMRLFRQQEPGQWESVFAEVTSALRKAVTLKKAA